MTTCCWARVEEELLVWPKCFVELHKELGVGAKVEALDSLPFPGRQSRVEFDDIVLLEDTEGKGTNGVLCRDTTSIVIVYGYSSGRVLNSRDFCIKQ